MTDNPNYHVGELADSQPDVTQFEAKPFKKGKPPEPLSFEVVMTAESTEKQRKTGKVQVNIPGFSPVKFYCDEDIPVGDDTAPPPLAFMCAGIGFCLMTHRPTFTQRVKSTSNPCAWNSGLGSPQTYPTCASWATQPMAEQNISKPTC